MPAIRSVAAGGHASSSSTTARRMGRARWPTRMAAADDHVRVLHRREEGRPGARLHRRLRAGARRPVRRRSSRWTPTGRTRPSLLPTLVARLDAGADLVLGVALCPRRRDAGLAAQAAHHLALRQPLRPARADPALSRHDGRLSSVWRADTLRAVDPASIDVTGYVFMIELVDRAHLLRARIAQVPVRLRRAS